MNNEFILENSKDGYKLLKIKKEDKWKYLGSKYNQEREVNKFLESFDEITENDIYIILGMSFGEHIQKLREKVYWDNKILIIETNERWVKYLKNEKCCDEIFNNKNIFIATCRKDVEAFFQKYVNPINIEFVKIKGYSNYIDIFKKDLSQIYESIKQCFNKITIERNTALFFSQAWLDTTISNIEIMYKSTPINNFKDKFENTPAVIISAGPSLEKNIDLLKNFNNGLIMSGGRTLRVLNEKKIDMDLLTIIDPGDVSYNLVRDYIDDVKCPMLFYEGTNKTILNRHTSGKIFGTDNDFMKKIFKQDIESISYGGSVAHTMAFCAAYMGCNPIIFIGQDLAYTDYKLHSDLASDEDSKSNIELRKRNDDIFIKDIYGNMVRTSLVMDDFRLQLEELIKNFPNIQFIDATEGGAYIKGTSIKPLNEVLEEIKFKVKPHSLEEFLIDVNLHQETLDELKYLQKMIIETNQMCEKGIILLQQFYNMYKIRDEQNFLKINKKLSYIDKKLRMNIRSMDLFKSELFNVIYYMSCDKHLVISDSDSKDQIIIKTLNKNKRIYEEMGKILKICLQKIEDFINRISNK